MSYITNAILITAIDDPGVEALNQLMLSSASPWKGPPFRSCDSVENGNWYAGSKRLSVDMYPAAFNYLQVADLVAMIHKVKWDEPAHVQLLLCDEDDLRFCQIDLFLAVEE